MGTYDDDEEYRFYADPANQIPGENASSYVPRPRGHGTVISCRFPDQDMALLQDALAIRGSTVSSFIRRAVYKFALEVTEEHLLSVDTESEWGEPLEPRTAGALRHIWTDSTAPETAVVGGPQITSGSSTPILVHLDNGMWAEMAGGGNFVVHEGRTLLQFPDGTYAAMAPC